MKIAFSTSGTTLDAPVDSRFGRTPYYLVYDTDTDTFEVIDNAQNLNAPQGAGIQSAEIVVRAGASAVVTGHCGPKAFGVLSAAGIAIHTTTASTVAEALEQYRSGALAAANSADVQGHWM